jgi:hypothetical protein
LEPVFAQLVTDPQFSQTANEFLQPRSYGERHYDGAALSLHTIEDCAACAPHRLVFLAKDTQPKPPVATVTEIHVQKRDIARSHGPKPRKRTS